MEKLTRGFPYKRKADIAFAFLFMLVLAFNIWIVPFSKELTMDEVLYLAIPHRMLQGDSFLLHEWQMSQMASFLILPLVRGYIAVFTGTDGIMLVFRYIYVFFHGLVSLFIFLRLRKTNPFGAAAASLYYQVFCYANIMALSYNTMGIGLMIVTCISLAEYRGGFWEAFLIGLCFAAAVLCCPFLLIAYIVYTLAVFFFAVSKKTAGEMGAVFNVRTWLSFSSACFLLAAAFFLRMVLFGDIEKLFDALPYIIVDEEHPQKSFLEWLYSFYGSFYRSCAWFKEIVLASMVLTGLIFLDRKKRRFRSLWLICGCIITLAFSVQYLLMYRDSAYLMFPMAILGFFAFLLCEHKNWRMFWLVYIPGCIFWVCRHMSSNLGFFSISAAASVNMLASMIFLAQLLAQMHGQHKNSRSLSRWVSLASGGLAIALVCSFFCTMLISRLEGIPEDRAAFSSGSAKGIEISRDWVEAMEREYEALAPLRELEEGNVLYFTEINNLRYLEDEKKSASHSMWITATSTENSIIALEKMEKYWQMFPEKKPDYVYVAEHLMQDGQILAFFEDYEYTQMSLDTGVVLCVEWR